MCPSLVFFDLCDDDEAGVLDEEKLNRFLKKNLKTEYERKEVKGGVRSLMKEIPTKVKGHITK